MATRAPSLSNSCAAASPIPLLPPVIRISLFVSLPIVVTPSDLPVPLLHIPPACAPSPSRNPCASSQPTTLTWDRGRCPPPRSPLHRRWPAQRTPERPSVR